VPYYFDILEGCAQGAKLRADEILDTCIAIAFSKSRLGACSGIAIARDGKVVVGQNWDTGPESCPTVALEVAEDEDGRKAARFSWANPLEAWIPLNCHGLSMSGASGGSGTLGDGVGMPVTLYRRMFFDRCRSVEEARRLVEKHPMIGKGANQVFADASGAILGVELEAGRHAFSKPEEGVAVMTGCRVNLRGKGLGSAPPAKAAAERRRRDLLVRLCQAARRERDLVAALKRALATHDDGSHPHSSPCRHDGTNCTQYSFVVDLTERRYYYCGQPCRNEWRCIQL